MWEALSLPQRNCVGIKMGGTWKKSCKKLASMLATKKRCGWGHGPIFFADWKWLELKTIFSLLVSCWNQHNIKETIVSHLNWHGSKQIWYPLFLIFRLLEMCQTQFLCIINRKETHVGWYICLVVGKTKGLFSFVPNVAWIKFWRMLCLFLKHLDKVVEIALYVVLETKRMVVWSSWEGSYELVCWEKVATCTMKVYKARIQRNTWLIVFGAGSDVSNEVGRCFNHTIVSVFWSRI